MTNGCTHCMLRLDQMQIYSMTQAVFCDFCSYFEVHSDAPLVDQTWKHTLKLVFRFFSLPSLSSSCCVEDMCSFYIHVGEELSGWEATMALQPTLGDSQRPALIPQPFPHLFSFLVFFFVGLSWSDKIQLFNSLSVQLRRWGRKGQEQKEKN